MKKYRETFSTDGQRFAVVVSEKGTDADGADRYSYATIISNSKKYAEENDYPAYGLPVLHEGESFVFEGGKWTDWIEGVENFKKAHEVSDDYVIENLGIKAYLTGADAPKPVPDDPSNTNTNSDTPGKNSDVPKTGDTILLVVGGIAVAAIVGAGAVALARRRRS